MPESILNKLHLIWHMALLLFSAWVAQQPKYIWLIPVLQAYGQITPPPEFPSQLDGVIATVGQK